MGLSVNIDEKIRGRFFKNEILWIFISFQYCALFTCLYNFPNLFSKKKKKLDLVVVWKFYF